MRPVRSFRSGYVFCQHRRRLLSTTTNKASETTDFGFKTVPTASKKAMVGDVFRSVAQNYDVMNDLMSVGIHRVWKEHLVNTLNPQLGMQLLDVAGGTGDVAFRCMEAINSNSGMPALETTRKHKHSHVVVCDINSSMLSVGQERAARRGYLGRDEASSFLSIEFVEGDAEKLPFASESFDVYTIAFGLRNVTNIPQAISEAYRVLKKGGRFLCLEFSHVQNPVLAAAYDQYSFLVIPALGEVVAGDRASYQYLVESIRKFPQQEELVLLMQNQGFALCNYENLTFGVTAIHSGFKLS
eukprot:gb/GEZN01012630.1/.p1 GENE.gb/GEZN01012630.1/~~gb/GEZN01012630.1/.p1  ORF type:complete len:298 (+),score=33.17 gb/GEZN01012630.1/:26-919(+)